MIKANELRIGNLVEQLGIGVFHEDGTVSEVDPAKTITITAEIIGGAKDCYAMAMFKPIPLTEEWLMKFGFEKDIIHSCFVIYQNESDIEISFYPERNGVQISGQNSGEDLPIKYVHQLQNLYFALTGHELEVKP